MQTAARVAWRPEFSLKAFVVEDNAVIRESHSAALMELAGITTAGAAADEKTAKAWLTDEANEWDVAIVDLILEPGGSGFGVPRSISFNFWLTGSKPGTTPVRKSAASQGESGQ